MLDGNRRYLELTAPDGRLFNSKLLFAGIGGGDDVTKALKQIRDEYVVDFTNRRVRDVPHLFWPARLYVLWPCLHVKQIDFYATR